MTDKRTEVVRVRLTAKEKLRIVNRADKDDRTISDLLRLIVFGKAKPIKGGVHQTPSP